MVDRYKGDKNGESFLADEAFAKPEIYEYLAKEGYRYAIRIPANKVLQAKMEHLLTGPVGQPSEEPIAWKDQIG